MSLTKRQRAWAYLSQQRKHRKPPEPPVPPEPPAALPLSFTLTAGSLSVITGYQPGFAIGSISREPIPDTVLDVFYSRSDTENTTCQFKGQWADYLSNFVMLVNGVAFPVEWIEAESVGLWFTGSITPGVVLPADGDYEITWAAA